MAKTSRDDALAPSAYVNLLETMSMLMQEDWACTMEVEAEGSVEIRLVLDEPNEVNRGRQKELYSLREMGVATTVQRNFGAGHRVIQTRWVDRRNGSSVKSRLVLRL